MKIGIVNYGMGNLYSVQNALNFLNIKNGIINREDNLNEFSHLIIPGVGAFKEAMENLKKIAFIEKLKDFKKSGKYILGICLGMQLLVETGTEPEVCCGLNLIPGKIVKFELENLRIPHVGWNKLYITNFSNPLFYNLKQNVDFYFVHSYHYQHSNDNFVDAYTDYGFNFPSVISNENVIGTQFHPEKSQKHGLKMLENFSKL